MELSCSKPEYVDLFTESVLRLKSPSLHGKKEKDWTVSETIDLPKITIQINAFAKGKDRNGVVGTGDACEIEILNNPGQFTVIRLSGIDCFSPADERAAKEKNIKFEVWKPLAKKFGSILTSVANEVLGCNEIDIPWDYSDVAGSMIFNAITDKSRGFVCDIFSNLFTNLYRDFNGKFPSITGPSAIREAIQFLLVNNYLENSRWFTLFAKGIEEKTKGKMDKSLLWWYLNGVPQYGALVVSEIPRDKQLSLSGPDVFAGFFGSSSDIAVAANSIPTDYRDFNSQGLDNNQFADELIFKLAKHITPKKLHQLVIQKPRFAGYSSLRPDMKTYPAEYKEINRSSVFKQNSGLSYELSSSNDIELSLYTDGFTNRSTDLNRDAPLIQNRPTQLELLSKRPEHAREYLRENGYGSDDMLAVSAVVKFK